MNKNHIIEETKKYVQHILSGESSGHDWWHVFRVWNNAMRICEHEDADSFVVALAALLHDIADYKFHGGDDTMGPRVAKAWLESLAVDAPVIAHVCDIVRDISFKGAGVADVALTKEAMIVQDADRLDALGAIGIARTFAYGGHTGRAIYDPDEPPHMHGSFEEYKHNTSHTVNHFYEKLFLLKDRMHTQTAKRMAQERHAYMEAYLERLYQEWEGHA